MVESIKDTTRTSIATNAQIRSFTGYSSTKDIGDADLTVINGRATLDVLRDVAFRAVKVELDGSIDASNTTFRLPSTTFPYSVIMDETLDETTDGSDILVQSRFQAGGADFPTWTTLTVSTIDAFHGIITLSAAPDPATVDAIEFTGYLVGDQLEKDALGTAIILKAAIYVDRHVRGTGEVNLTNPGAQNKDSAGATSRQALTWLDLYRKEIRRLRKPAPRMVVTESRLPGAT